MAQSDYPIIRISALANRRAEEIVKALKARGIAKVSKAQVVSELILSMPIPQPQPAEKKRRAPRKVEIVSTTAAAV